MVVPLGGIGGFYFALLQMTYESHSSMTNLTKREREREEGTKLLPPSCLRFCRPVTADFANDLAKSNFAR